MTLFEYINHSAFYLGTLLVVMSCLIFTMVQRHTDRPQNIIYIISIIMLALTAGANMLYDYALPMAAEHEPARWSVLAANYVYFFLHGLQSLFLLYYALFATRNFQRIQNVDHVLYMTPCIVDEVMVILNPWTHWVFYFDVHMEYHRGWGQFVIYAVAAFYIIVTIWLFFFKWYGINIRKRLIIYASLIICVIGILVQTFVGFAMTELFAEAIALMGLMLALEYDEDRLDTATGVYNRSALRQDTLNYFENRRKFYAVCLRITNTDSLQRVVGTSDQEEVFRMIAEYLCSVHPRYMIYRATPSSFVLLNLRSGEGQVRFLSQMISWKLEEGWEYQGRALPMHGTILYASVPDEIHSPEELLLMCESPIPPGENGAILVGEDLRAVLYRASMETALHRGLAEHNFRVFYQPVYTPDGKHIDSAESLIRLNDPEFGELSPGDFIPAAERNGMIEQLGEYTLEEVCRFLESGVPAKLGIRYININLSVVQCMNPDFVARMKRIVNRHTVLPSWINFEIMENVAALDLELLDSVIRELKAEGFRFSVEGYGTGYANLYSIFSLDFDIIKMDKRLLWESGESEDGWTILENSVRMVHELSHEVVLVGVETKEQFERTQKLHVDWYQGNYFSRPVSREDLEKMAEEIEEGKRA